jgi:hypothetical protein
MVFVFFGLVAVIGTTYVQTQTWEWAALYAAGGIGALACAILVVNNLRDIPTDTLVGKRTLAVVLGDRRTRLLYLALVVVAVAAVLAVAAVTTWWALAGLAFVVLAVPAASSCGGCGCRCWRRSSANPSRASTGSSTAASAEPGAGPAGRRRQSTSSFALSCSNAAVARAARSSTLRANAARCRSSRNQEPTPLTRNAMATAHRRGTWSATIIQMPTTIPREARNSTTRRAV